MIKHIVMIRVKGSSPVEKRKNAETLKDAVDGLMGQRTRAAIRSFQREVGMPETGEISEQLLSKLKRIELELE